MIQIEIDDRCARAVWMDPTEMGEFAILFGTTWSLSIYLEEQYQGKGLAKRLIQMLCKELEQHPNRPLPSKRLYIDTDASGGFWDHLGMQDNPMYDFTEDQRNSEGAGYEKYIEFSKLLLF